MELIQAGSTSRPCRSTTPTIPHMSGLFPDDFFESMTESLLINRPVVLSSYGVFPSLSHHGPDRFRLQCDDRSSEIVRVPVLENDPALLFPYYPFDRPRV